VSLTCFLNVILINVYHRLQERVKEIQGVVKGVVPVFEGNEAAFTASPSSDTDLLGELQGINVNDKSPLAGKTPEEIVAKFKALLELEAAQTG